MRIIATIAVIVLSAAVASASWPGTASARGPSPGQLRSHGWNCFNVEGLGVHCQPPGDAASSATMTLLIFDTSNPGATDAPFLGTELLIRADLYQGQPCPQEGLAHYVDLRPELPYFACHRYS